MKFCEIFTLTCLKYHFSKKKKKKDFFNIKETFKIKKKAYRSKVQNQALRKLQAQNTVYCAYGFFLTHRLPSISVRALYTFFHEG